MGQSFAQHSRAWTYRYNQRNPTSGGTGVGHAAENWMMFLGTNTGSARLSSKCISILTRNFDSRFNGSTTFTPMTPVEVSFAEELIAYWLSFVRAGDPNTFKLARSPTWTEYTAQKARIVLQQDPKNTTTLSGSFVELEAENETRRCAVVASKVQHQEN